MPESKTVKEEEKVEEVTEGQTPDDPAGDAKAFDPETLLKENTWEKMVNDKLKVMIDNYIHVLKQTFKENDDEGDGDGVEGDGTQIRTYINSVTIKALMSDITGSGDGDSKN